MPLWTGNVNSLRVMGDLQAGVYQRVYTKHVTVADDYARDGYDVLDSHFDGADGATAYTDPIAGAATFVGTAQLDTAQYKFGTASLLLDGNSDCVTYPDSASWAWGAGDWTVDGWYRYAAIDANNGFWSHSANGAGDRGIWLYLSGGTSVNGVYSTDGTAQVGFSFSWTPSIDTWYHLAWVRNGADLKFYVNGTQTGSTFNIGSNSIFDSTELFYVGKDNYDGLWHNGWIDEFRVSKGIARWTANFTPPTLPYGVTSLTVSGLAGNTDEEYILRARIVNRYNGSNNILVNPNNDSGANYGYQYILGSDASAAAGRYTDGFIIANNNVLGQVSNSKLNLYAKSGYVRTSIGRDIYRTSTTTVTGVACYGYAWNNTADEITSLVVLSSQNGGIGADSVIELFKKVSKGTS